jgi:cytochrome P450
VADLRALDEMIYREIAARRAAGDLGDRADVLSRLLAVGQEPAADTEQSTAGGLRDVELRDQLVTLLLAGHETTATALAWALYELGRDRALLARARGAAADGDDGYLEAVMKEALRLHPVIPMVVRHLMAPATIGGRRFPRGTNVAPSILLSHQSAASFPDPDSFRPERFLDGRVAPNTWIPFGGGVRRCLGAGFSLMEGVAVLREVLGRYDVALPRGAADRPRVRNITSVPRHGARIVVF